MDLHEAVRLGSIADIESAIQEGCDINALDGNEATPLWYAELAWKRKDVASSNSQFEKETAISLGFHEIADFLIGTQTFEYQHLQDSDLEILQNEGFPRRDIAAFQQWERFIFVRRSEKLYLHRIFFDYALLLATKADHNAGLRIKIDDEIEMPLINASEKDNLEILAILIERPDIRLTICGKDDWPAFLYLLANSEFLASEKGQVMADMLSKEALDSSPINSHRAHLEPVFQNVLRLGDDVLVKQVIDLVQGAARISILPLLIRVNETNGLKWILDNDITNESMPQPILWVLLCNFFQHNPSSEALKPFIEVAESLVERAIWDRAILSCLNSRNFSFVKQFFYLPKEIPPSEVTEETLAGHSQASTDQALIKYWVDNGFANAALWGAILSGIWESPAFAILLSSSDIDLDETFPPARVLHTHTTDEHSPVFPGNPASPEQELPFTEPEGHSPAWLPEPSMSLSYAEQDHRLQLMLLEQQNKRRLILARYEQDKMAEGIDLLTWTKGKSPLAWAAAIGKFQLVEALLRTSHVNVNSQDIFKETPLMHAIAVNDRQIVEKLLEVEDIDVNLQDDEGRTAVFHAAQRGYLHIIQLLIETRKVDFSILNGNGETVLDLAKGIGRQDVIAALAAQERT
ncbi:uncharacterized protein PGRI_061550 [Penicillium griseofulvum]|uniref:Ankyrin repeat-containing domain-containing protein n=1 Tax=Penicillium patulum TaxID=5078 RepID=A0A135LMK1_PENPA|nr:uncharacterized protein PGRI_061550 [Penicillium griseofulvum]KXG50188.1 hypothetical protein PGRI_061550 [Penicillium griseofulvum]